MMFSDKTKIYNVPLNSKFVASWNHTVCHIYYKIYANSLNVYTQYHNSDNELFTCGIELSTDSRETKMAVDKWGKDGEAANAAFWGLVTRAKAANGFARRQG